MSNIFRLFLILTVLFVFSAAVACDIGTSSDDDDDDDDAIDGDDDDTALDDDDVNDDGDDDDDDTVTPWSVRCNIMVSEYYDECNNALFDMTRDEALGACENHLPEEIPWPCVIGCWEDFPDCALWYTCVTETCDLPQPDDDADNDVDDDADDDVDDDADDDVDDDDISLDYDALHVFNVDMQNGEEFVIRSQDQWNEFVGYARAGKLWYEIDFTQYMVVGVNTGAGGCAVWGQIMNIYRDQDSIDVSYATESGGPCDCYVNLPIFAVIAKSDLPVNFYPVDLAAQRDDELYSDLFLNSCIFDQQAEFNIRTPDDWNLFLGYEPGGAQYNFISMLNFDTNMVLGINAEVGGCAGIGLVYDISPDLMGNYLWFTYLAQGDGPCDSLIRVPIFATYPQSDLIVDFLAIE